MKEQTYIKFILSHIFIGFLVFLFPVLAKIYWLSIIIIGLYFVVKNKNKNNEVLLVAAYIAGAEVFLRTTFGTPFYEFGKYFIIFFVGLGTFYDGIPKIKNPYWIYLILLLPSIIIGITTIEIDIRKKLLFDILGPLCLGICAIYTYRKKVSNTDLDNILLSFGLPIISCCFFLLFAYPITNTTIENTESNYYLSGKFAPNQISTVLGFGTFIFFCRTVFLKTSIKITFFNIILTCCLLYRGLLSFSRGGMLTGLAIILLISILVFFLEKETTIFKRKIPLSALFFCLVFVFANYQTDNLLFKRYMNQNPSGLYKSKEVNGREDLALEEIEIFRENPITGIGAGGVKEMRKTKNGSLISTHNEMTRLLAEHGLFGVLSIILLIIFPLLNYFKNPHNYYLLCFYAFWFLTVNHSGMRTVSPAFIYALSLLAINKKDSVNLV